MPTNVNLALVSDGGQAVGSSGNQQGDTRFGDIRIGAIPLPAGTLAETFLPPPINGGTAAGEILINSTVNWQINASYDLMTVVAHEFGHALGLGESTVSTAEMYGTYNAIKQVLTSDDTSGIQSLYRPAPVRSVQHQRPSEQPLYQCHEHHLVHQRQRPDRHRGPGQHDHHRYGVVHRDGACLDDRDDDRHGAVEQPELDGSQVPGLQLVAGLCESSFRDQHVRSDDLDDGFGYGGAIVLHQGPGVGRTGLDRCLRITGQLRQPVPVSDRAAQDGRCLTTRSGRRHNQ